MNMILHHLDQNIINHASDEVSCLIIFCLHFNKNHEKWKEQEVVNIGSTLDFSKQFESHLDSISIDEL